MDSARALAYSLRLPAQLDTVYVNATLRDADAAELTGVVPVDCRLVGVTTSFRDLSVERSEPSAMVVVVTATLRPSTLVCHGKARARVPGTGPRRLRISLARTVAGYRVAGERAA